MNVALVFPRFKYPTGDVPLGVAYLASSIKRFTDANLNIVDTTFQHLRPETLPSSDLVAFSVMTTMMTDAIRLTQVIKKYQPDTKIIFGGPHPSVMPEETISNEHVDAVIIGEGEQTIVEIINNDTFQDVPGVWYKKDGKIIKNKPRQPIEDLDDLPFPGLDYFDMDRYFEHWFQLECVERGRKGLNMMTTRGCPYNCSFCQPTLKKIFGNSFRKRSPRNIVNEIKYWQKKYGINAVMFSDDTFIIDRKWVMDICDLLINEKVDILWCCNARANLVDEELFMKMYDAGLRKVCLGIESGTQRILDIYNKQITPMHVRHAVKILKDLDLNVLGYFMLGAPTETEEEINETIQFAKELDIDEATFSITTPLPGTDLYDKTKNHITDDISNLDYYSKTIYDDIALGQKKLNWLKKKAFLTFYLSKKHIGFTIKSFIGIQNIKRSLIKLKRF